MKHQIKHRCTDAVLFDCDVPEGVQASGRATRYALEKAFKDGADLTGAHLRDANLRDANLNYADLNYADLTGANLRGADLTGAYLTGANLDGANLTGANLNYADLTGANLNYANLNYADLRGANLTGAILTGAYLTGANLIGADLTDANLGDGEKLIGERPVFMTGPIGSRCDYLTAYLTDKGIRLRAGCFFGDIDTFRNKLETEHGDNDHAAEYRAALALIEKHVEIWTPKGEA